MANLTASEKKLLDALFQANAILFDVKYCNAERFLPAPVRARLLSVRAANAKLLKEMDKL